MKSDQHAVGEIPPWEESDNPVWTVRHGLANLHSAQSMEPPGEVDCALEGSGRKPGQSESTEPMTVPVVLSTSEA